ncbi:hypothetical protein ABI59_04030 [Acidobacteria bacterium Mor1]|nr:hypothetical protein ABI59_04030 [Acidobacteria bacterium Mor1]
MTLGREDSRHIARVLRLGPGDPVGVFDGRGNEWAAEILEAGKDAVRVRLGEACSDPVEAPLEIDLIQGVCRPDRLDWLVAKATEVGIHRIQLVDTERADAPRVTDNRLERWRRIAREACKQCGRRRVPEVASPLRLKELGPSPEDTLDLVLDGGPGAVTLATILAAEAPGRVRLAVGPESGFSDAERAALEAAGWRRASLGPRTLRTETAGPVATALLLHAWGDFGA